MIISGCESQLCYLLALLLWISYCDYLQTLYQLAIAAQESIPQLNGLAKHSLIFFLRSWWLSWGSAGAQLIWEHLLAWACSSHGDGKESRYPDHQDWVRWCMCLPHVLHLWQLLLYFKFPLWHLDNSLECYLAPLFSDSSLPLTFLPHRWSSHFLRLDQLLPLEKGLDLVCNYGTFSESPLEEPLAQNSTPSFLGHSLSAGALLWWPVPLWQPNWQAQYTSSGAKEG